jgi:hypothetical protein
METGLGYIQMQGKEFRDEWVKAITANAVSEKMLAGTHFTARR